MKKLPIFLFAFTMLFFFNAAIAGASIDEWRPEKSGATFEQMVQKAQNIVFATVQTKERNGVKMSITNALKGRAEGVVRVTGFREHPNIDMKKQKAVFAQGRDIYFFLNNVMMRSVPFKAIPSSIVIPVENGKLKTSFLAPTKEKYYKTYSFKEFERYIKALIEKDKNRPIDASFLGELMAQVEQNTGSREMADALFMLLKLKPTYDNVDALYPLIDHKDLNVRVLAYTQLVELAEADRRATIEKAKAEAAKTPKKKIDYTKIKTPLCKKIYTKSIDLLKKDSSRLMKSLAAIALSKLYNPSAIPILAELVDVVDDKPVEKIALMPEGGIENNLRAVVRAITIFEEDAALDALEAELRKNRVETFRLILDIFKEYADTGLHLLLLDLLQDANFLPRQVAILEYFRAIKDDHTIKGLKKLFVSPEAGSEFIRKSIIEVFQDFNEPAKTVPFIIKNGLHDNSPVVRQASARALGALGDIRAVGEIKKIYFKESNRLARQFYVDALSEIRSRLAYETLKWLKKKEKDSSMIKHIDYALKKSKFLSR